MPLENLHVYSISFHSNQIRAIRPSKLKEPAVLKIIYELLASVYNVHMNICYFLLIFRLYKITKCIAQSFDDELCREKVREKAQICLIYCDTKDTRPVISVYLQKS